jgi:hypothetical protein
MSYYINWLLLSLDWIWWKDNNGFNDMNLSFLRPLRRLQLLCSDHIVRQCPINFYPWILDFGRECLFT